MTVNTTKITSGPYQGNGVADTFSYTFRVSDKSQLRVLQTDDTGVQTVLVLDTDYTVTGVGDDDGGNIVLTNPLPVDYTLYIRSDYEETQLTSFESQGGFFPEVHENAMDKLTFLIQQLRNSVDRTVRVSEDFPDTGGLDATLPAAEANNFLSWNEDGTALVNRDIEGPLNEAVDSAQASAEAAATSEFNAAASEEKASQWAANDEDEPVEPGEFSAKHYAAKASNAAASVPVSLTGNLPFVRTTGAADNIALLEPVPGDYELPFFKSDGTQDNIAIIGI